MSLTVTRAKVKEMCGVQGTDLDTPIDNLIADLVPIVEYAIKPEHIAATGDAGLQATLNLGAAEIVGGEFLAQLGRHPGAYDTIQIGDFFVTPLLADVADPFGLKSQGWMRLRPFLRVDPAMPAMASVGVSRGKRPREEEP
jgi:hypothetical protein